MLRFGEKSEAEKKLERDRILYESVKYYKEQIEDIFYESRSVPEYLSFVQNLEYELKENYDKSYVAVHGHIPK